MSEHWDNWKGFLIVAGVVGILIINHYVDKPRRSTPLNVSSLPGRNVSRITNTSCPTNKFMEARMENGIFIPGGMRAQDRPIRDPERFEIDRDLQQALWQGGGDIWAKGEDRIPDYYKKH